MESRDAGSLSSIRGTWGPERAGPRRTIKPAKVHDQEIIFYTDPEQAFAAEDNANQLTEFELQECKEAFRALNVHGRGTISTEDLETQLQSLRLDPGLPEVQDFLMEKKGETGDGEVTFSEFLCLVAKVRREKEDEDLREAFFMLDSENRGSIGKNEVKQMMANLGHTLTDEEAAGMIREADTTGDGRISFQEFCKMMKSS